MQNQTPRYEASDLSLRHSGGRSPFLKRRKLLMMPQLKRAWFYEV